jgi:FkbM family methyltransferase
VVRRWLDIAVWWLSARVFKSVRYRARRGLHSGLNIVGGLGFVPSGGLTPEEKYLSSLDLTGKIVYDVGAFIGLRTLFFATRAKQVISYEPNAQNRKRLLSNLEANPSIRNVTVRPVGAGQSASTRTLVWDDRRPGECVDESSPVGRMLLEGGIPVRRETISIVSLDDEVRSLPSPEFIKVDVEGLELDVLRGASQVLRDHRPELFIELHGSTLENKVQNANAVMDLLFDYGYSIYDVEEHKPLVPGQKFQAAPSHIHCTLRPRAGVSSNGNIVVPVGG